MSSGNFVVIPGLLWIAWLAVSAEHKERLSHDARSRAVPWPFFALVAAVFLTSFAIDLAYPGQDAFSPMIDGWVEDWLGEGAA